MRQAQSISVVFTGALALFVAVSSEAQAGKPAEATLFVNGHIYTADPAHPWADSLATSGDRIVAVGAERAVRSRARPGSRLVDLKGRTVVPGLIDAHMHLLFGAMELAGFSLSTPEHSLTPAQPEALVRAVRDFAAAHPHDRILVGRADFSSIEPSAPTHALLDRAVSDRPVVVHNSSEHVLWVNAKALELAGITERPVADPEEERYVIRDASGRPTGVLLEAAQELIERAVLRELDGEQKLALLRAGMRYLNGFGITSIVNATGDLAEIELYGKLHERGELTVRTRTAFGAVAVPHRLTEQLLRDLEAARSRYHDEWVSANLVKFFADGSTGLYPPLVYRAADYKALVLELDKRGFQLMTHAERRDSVELVLDAYENALRVNGPRERRWRIEHSFVVSDADVARFAAMHVIAGVQPAFCCGEAGTSYDPGDPTPSDRWHTLLAAGVVLALSTDWPCMWPADPFVNMQQAVTREVWQSPDTAGIEGAALDGARQGGAVLVAGKVFEPEERITIQQAVDAYTRGSAYAAFAEQRVGSLEPGKLADLAVLSQDIFSVPAGEISRTRATLTMVGGRIVFEAP
ncbi:MAG: amidohydrolase [Proteobacteria bacterium]|nr:amidohydrolase [Pseudomonadota bacterium]